MREVDASWKRAIEVVEQLEKLARVKSKACIDSC